MYKQDRYPENWPQMARECKDRANWQCEHCTVEQGAQRIGKRTGNPYRVALAAAHLDHDPKNPDPRLAALCPECHGRYDWNWRARQADGKIERMKHRMELKRRGLR